ncbi:MAG: glycosyltransferase family 4 protein, partial [Acidobacteria bacterium]|nr:glycosyltransferase family 4 protein [Acidobacteriota bacterium]
MPQVSRREKLTFSGLVCLTLYAGPRRGGCYERLVRLMESLLRRGWTVHYVGLAPPEPAPAGLLFHPVKARGRGNPSLRTLAACAGKSMAICLREGIHFIWTFGAVYTAMLAPLRLLPGRRLVTFLRGSLVEQELARRAGPIRRGLARLAERLARRASYQVVAVSSDLARRTGGDAIVLPNDVGPPY